MRLIQKTGHRSSDLSYKNMLAHPFRLFFLAAGLYAILAILGWSVFLFSGWPITISWTRVHWHSHEMLYGFVVAAIAGFLLTAMTNWTGATPLQNRKMHLAYHLMQFPGYVYWLQVYTRFDYIAGPDG